MIKIYKPSFEQLLKIEQEKEISSDGITIMFSFFIGVVLVCLVVALIALYIDVKKVELSHLSYDYAKMIFANCLLIMAQMLFVDHLKTLKVFGYCVSGLFLALGSYLIWAS